MQGSTRRPRLVHAIGSGSSSKISVTMGGGSESPWPVPHRAAEVTGHGDLSAQMQSWSWSPSCVHRVAPAPGGCFAAGAHLVQERRMNAEVQRPARDDSTAPGAHSRMVDAEAVDQCDAVHPRPPIAMQVPVHVHVHGEEAEVENLPCDAGRGGTRGRAKAVARARLHHRHHRLGWLGLLRFWEASQTGDPLHPTWRRHPQHAGRAQPCCPENRRPQLHLRWGHQDHPHRPA
mmetsp:Transcript_10148/g.31998  ORF Transcript_10148/g.31998 Transcript_10148/m.31998 type:complete len:232 (-) Transcript_10148:1247-1942(-)